MPITDDISDVPADYRPARRRFWFEPDIRFAKKSWARIRLISSTMTTRNQLDLRGSSRRFPASVTECHPEPDGIHRGYLRNREYHQAERRVFQDFFQSEFQLNPQPDNIVAVTKSHPNYTLTALGRFQVNEFFETTERLPELALDMRRQPLFGGPIFYEGETSLGELHRSFAEDSGFHDYSTLRLDSFHQFTFPNTFFGWLSVVPRVGFRATYYDKTRDLGQTIIPPSNTFYSDFLNINRRTRS